MPYNDLRQFLSVLEDNNQLLKINEKVMPEPDISAAAAAVNKLTSSPALLFNDIAGYHNRVAMNVHGSWENHALMLDMDKNTSLKKQFHEMNSRWLNYPVEPVYVDQAPCKENIINEDINLFELLSLFRVNKGDAGFYISKASIISRDPEFPDDNDKQNVGIYRLQVTGKDELSIQPSAFHDIGIHFSKAERNNEPLDIAITIGNEPVITLMASTPLGYDQSEYKMAGAIQQKPYELIKAETSNLDLPAGTEIVLEGKIYPNKRVVEGPFGEFPGSYSGARKQPTVKIHTVTHRNNPIFENLYVGMPWTEIDHLIALNTSVPVYQQLKEEFPEVQAVNAMYTHGIGMIISVKSRFGGFAKAVANRVFSTPHGMPFTKIVIVVDEYVDPFDLNQVMWAMTVRVDPTNDVQILNNMPGVALDPTSNPSGMSSKMIIDATTPVAPARLLEDTNLVTLPDGSDEWLTKLQQMIKDQ
ncbi:phenolic acid decarboxylase subunit C [Vibrio inusitatus NBRC 102082]|uniref:3-octaprenyl-4-hydroxybenzoate carboxy-lyase n=1 Tax=Vibrio inusitatus NBRC 102082 TaxID=1219070 RepID=A0A4Y3HZ10_9VIBR|nr:non-oxidative hydroxyarylic acid decarboxylases subunit C [Vibrio inusitatus]GEA52275.1 phenolic acid decarboxylase subunit C [Vibrio inusitatus NBRC 102082]